MHTDRFLQKVSTDIESGVFRTLGSVKEYRDNHMQHLERAEKD
jgi:hypothetical protein